MSVDPLYAAETRKITAERKRMGLGRFGTRTGYEGFEGSPEGSKAKKNDQGWDQPRPLESALPPVMAFDSRLLPSSLGDYVLDAADRQQAPPDFAAVAALCGLASIAGNRVRMKPKRFDDWAVPPNLWGAAIGASSTMKTPAIRSALGPVFELQDQLKKAWEAEQRDAAVDADLSELEAKATSKKAASALKSGNREEAKRILAERAADNDTDRPCPRLIVNDATVEKLGELLNHNPRGMLLIRDELPGFLAKMESDEFQSERAFYLEAFNGDGQFTYDRIGRGTIHIENCTLSIIGGVQPSRIVPLVRGAMSGSSDDGLIQSCSWPSGLTPSANGNGLTAAPTRLLANCTSALSAPCTNSQSGSPPRLSLASRTKLRSSSGKSSGALQGMDDRAANVGEVRAVSAGAREPHAQDAQDDSVARPTL